MPDSTTPPAPETPIFAVKATGSKTHKIIFARRVGLDYKPIADVNFKVKEDMEAVFEAIKRKKIRFFT